jgi:hypothetical protein
MEWLETRKKLTFKNESSDVIIKTNIGFLCEKVGAGKSIEILSLIVKNPVLSANEGSDKMFRSNYLPLSVFITKPFIPENHKSNIIVVPKAILNQWKKYVYDFTNLTCETLTNYCDVNNFKDKNLQPDIVLVTNTTYNYFANQYQNVYFSRVIIDEVDSIRIPNCSVIYSNFYWFLTASIWNLLECRLNHNGFIKNTLYDLKNENISYLYVKNSDHIVDLSMKLPQPIINEIKCKASNILNVLNGAISNEIKLMISAGDISNAINELNIFGCENSNIIDVVSFNLVKRLENEKMKLAYKETLNYSNNNEKQKALEFQEKIVKDLEEKITMIKNRIDTTALDPITYEEIEYPVITKCCQNKFEFTSLFEYMNLQIKKNKPVECPLCRKPGLSQQSLVYIKKPELGHVPAESGDYLYQSHTKYENLAYLLKNKIPTTSKILIMSEFQNSFNKDCINVLEDNKLKWMSIATPYVHTNTIIDKYKKGDVSILLMDARNFGAGINLENTEHIIVLHKMNTELEKQIIGRAQRLGRTSTLNVWKLEYLNE